MTNSHKWIIMVRSWDVKVLYYCNLNILRNWDYHSWISVVAGAGRVRLHQSLYISVSSIDQTNTQLHVAHLRLTYIQVRCVIFLTRFSLQKAASAQNGLLCKLFYVYVETAVFMCLLKIPPGGLCTWGTELSWARLNEGLIGRQRTGTLQWPLWSCWWRQDVKVRWHEVPINTKTLDSDLDLHHNLS